MIHLLDFIGGSWYSKNMKTATCKECKGTGTITIFVPASMPHPIDMKCWFCSGTGYKGMNREQITWYKKMYKSLETLKPKFLRAGDVTDPAAWATLKTAINKACGRLQIALQTIPNQKATAYGQTVKELYVRAELKEYERRLTLIPVVMAAKLEKAA